MNLKIDGLGKKYPGGLWGLRGFSLELGPGVLGLLGPNGAGKSTLMRMLATVSVPSEGTARWDGEDIAKQPEALRPVLGYLPQDFGVYPNLNAIEFLEYMAAAKGLSRKQAKSRIEELLLLVNLTDASKRPLGGFSGGMRQRVGIAQALLNNPQLLIVDEPTAGLDPEERNRFHNILSEISAEVVVLLSTHIVDDVRQLCPRLAILREGELVYQGLTNDALDMAAGRVWRCCLPRAASPEALDEHLVLRSRRAAGDTVVHVWSASCPGDRFVSVVPELEDVYFALVRGYLPAGRAD